MCAGLVDEIDRMLEETMGFNAAAFSESVSKFYDGKWAGLKALRDWIARG